MKTLTVTYHFGTSYGALLQAYALQQTIISLGHENDILDYLKTPDPVKKKTTIKSIAQKWYLKFLKTIRHNQFHILNKSFADFHKDKLHLTRMYTTMEDLQHDPQIKEYNALITGSDQVWKLTSIPPFVDARLLNFGAEEAYRFSYAASLEELSYTDEHKMRLTEALQRYKGVSLREESARKYIESFTGLKCLHIIDPVFLLTKEQWMSIANKPRLQGPYILCYQVQRNTRMEEVAYELKRKTGYPVVSICNTYIKWIKSDYTFFDVSIEEFLGFYDQAAYVVSTSFHGVALGLVFDKPVYALVKRVLSNRIRDIMELMGLQQYLIEQEKKDPIFDYDNNTLNKMRRIRNQERQRGIDFLINMLS